MLQDLEMVEQQCVCFDVHSHGDSNSLRGITFSGVSPFYHGCSLTERDKQNVLYTSHIWPWLLVWNVDGDCQSFTQTWLLLAQIALVSLVSSMLLSLGGLILQDGFPFWCVWAVWCREIFTSRRNLYLRESHCTCPLLFDGWVVKSCNVLFLLIALQKNIN